MYLALIRGNQRVQVQKEIARLFDGNDANVSGRSMPAAKAKLGVSGEVEYAKKL